MQFRSITDEMANLYDRKNSDYGNSFDRSIDQFGLVASAVRLGDKYNRFSQLLNANQQVKDESIRDTLIDLANYAVMTILWLDEKGEVVNEESYRL
ncbi:nucleotide modification associated domain-containing protein [Aerococcus urinae]|uniref:nucleotide modification associated domain-containing protein n=1 Tax=Aerococcus urinae TaxID=1376 RepID=UPI00254CA83C|nr:nucleotide modification associated domain-containing protein [Aerococcus urinae]MDK8483973.1 nucleotide modification associated domain-containing protein [Aerococcus urinae]